MNTDKLGAFGVGLVIVGILALFTRAAAIGIITAIEKNEPMLGIGVVLIAAGLAAVLVALVVEYRK